MSLSVVMMLLVFFRSLRKLFWDPVSFYSSGLVRNYDKFYYVSLKATLEKVMNISFVLDQVIINIFISTKYN